VLYDTIQAEMMLRKNTRSDAPCRDASTSSCRLPGREGARMIARHHARRHNRMSQA